MKSENIKLIGLFNRKSLLVVSVLILLLTVALSEVALSQADETDKKKVVHQVALKWIEIGKEQYKRGYYRASEQSFLRAQDYKEYLTAAEWEELGKLLGKVHKAAVERERVPERIQKEAQSDEVLTEQERGFVAEQITEQKQEIAKPLVVTEAEPEQELPGADVEGAEDKLLGVESEAVRETEPQIVREPTEAAVIEAAEPKVPEAVKDEGSYIEVIKRKRNILQIPSHLFSSHDYLLVKPS